MQNTMMQNTEFSKMWDCSGFLQIGSHLNGEIFEFCSYFQLAHELVSQFLPLGHYDVCMGVCVEVQQYQ